MGVGQPTNLGESDTTYSHMAEKEIDKKGIVKVLVFALILAFLVIGVLGWQYRRIEKEQVPALEERLDQKSAEVVLEKFMHARIQQNEKTAVTYLTEAAVEQKNKNEFSLLGDYKTYEILNQDKLPDGRSRFGVKIYNEDKTNDWVEVIILTKVSDQYYIDSVEMGG